MQSQIVTDCIILLITCRAIWLMPFLLRLYRWYLTFLWRVEDIFFVTVRMDLIGSGVFLYYTSLITGILQLCLCSLKNQRRRITVRVCFSFISRWAVLTHTVMIPDQESRRSASVNTAENWWWLELLDKQDHQFLMINANIFLIQQLYLSFIKKLS